MQALQRDDDLRDAQLPTGLARRAAQKQGMLSPVAQCCPGLLVADRLDIKHQVSRVILVGQSRPGVFLESCRNTIEYGRLLSKGIRLPFALPSGLKRAPDGRIRRSPHV